MTESFPNAENAFREAFSQSSPLPKILELIQSHPQLATITDLVSVYFQLAAEQPSQIDKLAGELVKLRDSKDVTVAAADNFGNPAQVEVGAVLNRELAEFHGNELVNVDDSSVTPTNEYLIASILSAVSLKYRLTDSPAQVGAITRGLHLKDKNYENKPESYEVIVLGACLQLLIAGSYLYGPDGTDVGKEDVPAALEAIQNEGIVKTPNGQKLLSATLERAKSGFTAVDADDINAWLILFPS